MREGYIFNIQRATLDDGPGVRTVLFLKGCPLRCPWCHNPEGQSLHHKLPGQPGIAEKSCTVKKAVDEAMLDKDFFAVTGGGVTLSGGEPLMQPEFSLGILEALKRENIHTCVETCGICTEGVIKMLIPYVDLWLFDIKLTDEKSHTDILKTPLSTVTKSLYELKARKAKIIIRCPIIPGVNDNEEHFANIRSLARDVNAEAVDILPYHKLGTDKYTRLGKASTYDAPAPEAQIIEKWESSVLF